MALIPRWPSPQHNQGSGESRPRPYRPNPSGVHVNTGGEQGQPSVYFDPVVLERREQELLADEGIARMLGYFAVEPPENPKEAL